jgi:predicted nucleic acid-binding protein
MTGPTPGVSVVELVVDAGVAIKWYVPEVHDAEAKRLLDPSCRLHVPELFFPEFGNIVWKKARLLKRPEITEQEGRDILGLLLGVDLDVHPMSPLLQPAYDIAVGPECPTVYDCCYLVLAEMLGCRLVTADRAFYDALKGGAHGPSLLWVADPL